SNRIEALFDSGGRVTHAIGVSVDVTKQREQLQSMKNSAARFEALLEAIDGKAWIVNHEGRSSVPSRRDRATKKNRPFCCAESIRGARRTGLISRNRFDAPGRHCIPRLSSIAPRAPTARSAG